MECVLYSWTGLVFLDEKVFDIAVYSMNAACDHNWHIAKNLFGCVIHREQLLMMKKIY